MRHTIFSVLLIATALAAPGSLAQDEGAYGVAPTDVPFGQAIRGEPLHRGLSLQNDKETPVRVELRADDETGEWALPEERNLTLAPRSTLDLPLRMLVPDDVPNGRYDGGIRVHFIPNATVAANTSGAKIAFAVRVNLSVEVSGTQVEKLRAGGLHVPNTEESIAPVFYWEVENAGNVRTQPTVLVVVRHADGTPVLEEGITGPILPPGLTENVTFRLTETLPRGQYVLEASLRPPGGPDDKEEVWFEVVEQGALRRSGTLGALTFYDLGSRQQVHRIPFGNAVELRTAFTNTGELPLKSTLVGYISQDGLHIADFASSEMLVDPGETTELRVRIPELPSPAQYVISAQAEYSGKITPSQDAILILEPTATTRDATPSPAWLLLVAGALAARGAACLTIAGKRRRESPP